MKSSKSSLGPSVEKIVARIEKVRRAADKAARSNRRYAHYKYLRCVLRAYVYFDNNALIAHLVQIAPSVLLTPVRKNCHALRVIVDATCSQGDFKIRSRWTRALEHAVLQKIDPEELTRFIRANGGIAGCADLASKTNRARNRRDRKDMKSCIPSAIPSQRGDLGQTSKGGEVLAVKNPWILF